MTSKILVVDDESAVQRLLVRILLREDYKVLTASSGSEALDLAVHSSPDLFILDVSLPEVDGIEVCRELRRWSEAPVLVLSGTREEATKVAALDAGADDYVTKPFTSGELLARVRALLRRAGSPPKPPAKVSVGDFEMNLALRELKVSGKPRKLTRTEFDIIAVLVRHADEVVNSDVIIDSVWGSEYFRGTQTLRVHIAHLRKKLEPGSCSRRYIITEPGVGYRLRCSP